MKNLFGDAFTGRVVESIVEAKTSKDESCYEISFSGTHKKLRINSDMRAEVWVDDYKTDTLFKSEMK